MQWALANGKIPDMIAIHAPTAANPLVSRDVIKLAKRRLSDRMFRQYYLAEFLDDGSVFINFRSCVRGTELDFGDSVIQRWFADKKEFEANGVIKRDVVIGVDWAKHKDYTVIFVIDPMTNPRRVVGIMRFQGLKYTDQIKELYQICKMYQNVGIILHDKTGVGEAIDDMLSPIPYPFEGVTFTNAFKSELVNNLGMSFEKETIELPNWPEMLKELDAFEVVVNKLGTTIYNAPEGMHDDIVMGLALAFRAASEYAGDFEIRYLEDLDDHQQPLDQFYQDLIEDDDDYL
jgi:phage FluMu gp28-like protein